MEAAFDDSPIVREPPLLLSHLSTVAVALPLFKEFGLTTLDNAFSELKAEIFNPAAPNGGGEDPVEHNRAKEKLRGIPLHLRDRVLEAAHGMEFEVGVFKTLSLDLYTLKKDSEDFFHWKSDGTINTIEMARELVLDREIPITKRFKIACKYFLEESVKVLWAEMEATGKTNCYNTTDSIPGRFWVRWLQEGSRVPWTQAAEEYLELPRQNSGMEFTRYSAFFPSLSPEKRTEFLLFLQQRATRTDFLLCLYSMTKNEQEELFREFAGFVLLLYLKWPLRRFFLETAEKLQSFISEECFRYLFRSFVQLDNKDFDHRKVFRDFLDVIPAQVKEIVKKNNHLKKKIDLYLNGTKRKENEANNESVNSKREVRSNRSKKATRK